MKRRKERDELGRERRGTRKKNRVPYWHFFFPSSSPAENK